MVKINKKSFWIYYFIILIVSMAFSVPMDIIIYKDKYNIDESFFLFNLPVYSIDVMMALWIVNLFNTRYDNLKFIFKVIFEYIILCILFFIVLTIASAIDFYLVKNSFSLIKWLSARIERSYIYSDLLESAIILFITKFVYLYDRQKLLEVESERFKYAKLKSQLNPHFLFNSLSTLSAMIYSHTKEQTHKYVLSLADIYRYALVNESKDFITIKEELDFIEKYIIILRTRFSNNLIFDIDIEEKYLSRKIPFLALQLLIENAIKHNVINNDKKLTITIKNGKNMICVSNNINPKIEFKRNNTEIGLKNIADRYKIYANKEIIIENDTEFFTVKIPIL
ncbi:MAG: histidine kinase [Bacteroidales bacterium]|nr:histidine kinase [Bacteroidales bacterium]